MATFLEVLIRGSGVAKQIESDTSLQRKLGLVVRPTQGRDTVGEWYRASLASSTREMLGLDSTVKLLSQVLETEVAGFAAQTTSSVFCYVRYDRGRKARDLGFSDGTWGPVEGNPEPWEAELLSDDSVREYDDLLKAEDAEPHAIEVAKRILESKKFEPDATFPYLNVSTALSAVETHFGIALDRPPDAQFSRPGLFARLFRG